MPFALRASAIVCLCCDSCASGSRQLILSLVRRCERAAQNPRELPRMWRDAYRLEWPTFDLARVHTLPALSPEACGSVSGACVLHHRCFRCRRSLHFRVTQRLAAPSGSHARGTHCHHRRRLVFARARDRSFLFQLCYACSSCRPKRLTRRCS